MSEEEMGTYAEPETQETQEPAAQAEPTNLSEAWQMYKEQTAKAAADNVEGGTSPDGTGAGDDADGSMVVAQSEEPGSDMVEPVAGGADAGAGDSPQPVDYGSRKNQMIQEIQRQASNNVIKSMQDAKVNLNWKIADLYERDERSGETRFRNPDRPGSYFNSRFEAQQYVDSMNKQIIAAYRDEVAKEQRRLLQQSAPQVRLLEFATAYEAMDKGVKDILDDLVEPYAVKNRAGQVVGYNCDLNAMARQATKIADRFRASIQKGMQQAQTQAKEPEPKQPGKKPAMDMKTGTGEAATAGEPKDLNEAMKMYREQMKGNK